MVKKTKKVLACILVSLVGIMVVCNCGIHFAIRVCGGKIPAPQVISSTNNICIAFTDTMGSGENVIMFTYRCSTLTKDADHIRNIYEQDQYLDEAWTMECPIIRLKDKDSDGFKEVHVTQDRLCKEFAHPWHEDSKKLFFIVNEAGEFIEADPAG